jgi:hypothetical protein
MKKDYLTSALENVLLNNSFGIPKPSEKAGFIISLCGFYGTEAMPEAIQAELTKLNSQIPMLLALENMLKVLEKFYNDFRWSPHFHPEHRPDNLTMNPTFNIQRGDESSIVAEIETIRNQLQQQPVNIALLISHIGTKAREAGHLNF